MFLTNARFSQEKIESLMLKGFSQSAHDLVQEFFVTHAVGEEVATRDQKAFDSIAKNMEAAIIKKFNDKPVVCELTSHFGIGTKL